MTRSFWLLSAAVLVSSSGCGQAPVEHTVRKVTTEDVRRDTAKAVDTATQAAVQAEQDFEAQLKASLTQMDAEIATLHDKGSALKDEVKARWDEKMVALKAKQKVAREKLEEFGKSAGAARERLEKGTRAAWDDLRDAFHEASKEF